MKASTRKLRKDHWFGVPRWLVVAVAVAVLVGYGTFGRPSEEPAPVSAEVRTIVEGLRTTSVHEAPDAPGKVDAGRARELIGDRPIGRGYRGGYGPDCPGRVPRRAVVVPPPSPDALRTWPRPATAADARRQAGLAGDHVRVLGECEAANTRSKLAAPDGRLTELEKEAAR